MRKSLAQSLEINIINVKIMQKFNSKAYCCGCVCNVHLSTSWPDLCLYIWTCIYKVHFMNVWKSWLWILIVVLPLKFIAEYIEIWSKIIYLLVYTTITTTPPPPPPPPYHRHHHHHHHNTPYIAHARLSIHITLYYKHYKYICTYVHGGVKHNKLRNIHYIYVYMYIYLNVYMHRHNKLSDRILRSLCMGNEKVVRLVRVVDIRIHFLHLWQIYYPYSIYLKVYANIIWFSENYDVWILLPPILIYMHTHTHGKCLFYNVCK